MIEQHLGKANKRNDCVYVRAIAMHHMAVILQQDDVAGRGLQYQLSVLCTLIVYCYFGLRYSGTPYSVLKDQLCPSPTSLHISVGGMQNPENNMLTWQKPALQSWEFSCGHLDLVMQVWHSDQISCKGLFLAVHVLARIHEPG